MTTTVAIDLDGVIYDIIGHITDKFLKHSHKGYRPSDWNCWLEFGISKEQFFHYYDCCWIDAQIDRVRKKYTDPNAKKLFDSIKEMECRINVITKRARHNIHDTVEYLNDMKFHYDQLTIINDTADKLKENFDIIIEDNPVNLPQNPPQMGILVDQAWNKNFKLLPNHVRIQNLLEAVPVIQKFQSLYSPCPVS